LRGALVGAASTAIVQSSSAVTSMAVGLAHTKALAHRIGANVGTTLTAWLIAMQIEGLGPVFLTLGGLWSLFGLRPWRPYGKAVFYFGLIFLALDLVSQGLAPITQTSIVTDLHGWLDSFVVALLAGYIDRYRAIIFCGKWIGRTDCIAYRKAWLRQKWRYG